MTTQTYLSSYLMPESRPKARFGLRRRLQLLSANRSRVRVTPRVALGIASWFILIGAVVYVATNSSLPDPLGVASRAHTARLAQTRLVSAVRAPELPSGPSGQLLPPGTMAAPYTYRNGYANGQCTWYVAGRRPIPSGWGNARSWYAHARSAGWSTGTTPAIAAIAWTPNGYFGHVAVVEAIEGNQVLISEMNYLGAYKIDKRWAPISSFKYIY